MSRQVLPRFETAAEARERELDAALEKLDPKPKPNPPPTPEELAEQARQKRRDEQSAIRERHLEALRLAVGDNSAVFNSFGGRR